MVGAAMAEGELEGLVSRCERQQLVTEADPEDRHASEQHPDSLDLVHERLRVARPIREQHAVEALELLRIRVVGEHRDGCAGFSAAEDRPLAPVVHHRDPRPSPGRVVVGPRRRETAAASGRPAICGCSRTARSVSSTEASPA